MTVRSGERLLLSPSFTMAGAAQAAFREYAERLAATSPDDRRDTPVDALNLAQAEDVTALRAALSVLWDLAKQGWSIDVTMQGTVEVTRPRQADRLSEKTRVRKQELVRRNEQLGEPATRSFIKGMECSVFRKGRPVSIFSLFGDGRDLAASLRAARSLPEAEKLEALRKALIPYLQFVEEAAVCEHTGFRLQDIWRYFRHTWSNQYTSTPGRWVAFLIRDRAKPFHPVIGIGAIGSPIVQINERDRWIGWHPEVFLASAVENPSAELGTWLKKIVDNAINELFVEDFLEEQILTPPDIKKPSSDVVSALRRYGQEQRELHHRLAERQELKRSTNQEENRWQARARTHLYRSKRALSLVDLLRARSVLRKHIGDSPSKTSVQALLNSSDGRQVVRNVLRKAKADRVGIGMADITVCGAVPPYGEILGGKLVSMLAASPEVIVAYGNKYADQQSEIASSMSGQPVVRPSHLAFLGTTSLYGVGSSQYNRLRMPAEALGGIPGKHLEYLELGKSEAYGTSHFSAETVESLVALLQQRRNGQRVNSIFGEGVNPKLRKLREGLSALGLPVDELLQHGRQRIVYGVPLVRNLRNFLIGMDDSPDYLFDLTAPERSTSSIVEWWMKRWLSKRIMNDEVLARTERHTLVRPVRHGARVVLPKSDVSQGHLFEEC